MLAYIWVFLEMVQLDLSLVLSPPAIYAACLDFLHFPLDFRRDCDIQTQASSLGADQGFHYVTVANAVVGNQGVE